MSELLNYNTLKDIAHNFGISLFGVAKLTEKEKEDFLIDKDITQNMDFAISIGYALSGKILETISYKPNKIYFFHYRLVNQLLDFVSLKIVSYIQEKNYDAFPVPASQIIDWQKNKGVLSHKRIGVLAGLGIIGKNNLLVSPAFGARIRLATVLTNMPLVCDRPVEGRCNNCNSCVNICPASAIYNDREDFKIEKCFEQLKKFSKEENISQYICGLCVKVCTGEGILINS